MRKTGFEERHEPIVVGDPDVGRTLGEALLCQGDVDRGTHGFHTYPAGLHPDAAQRLVHAFPGSVLDPFCGGGTVCVEGRIAGRVTVGSDVSPVALIVARTRTTTETEAVLTTFRSAARKATERARSARDLPPPNILRVVEPWYAPAALTELESLRRSIAESDPAVRDLLWTCFSSILVKVSWRKSDTSAKRVKHVRPAGTTAVLFHKKVRELGRRIASLRELVPADTPPTTFWYQDVRRLTLPEPVDVAITSPPYPSTYDYLSLQHLRLVWMGLRDEGREIGARRQWREGERQARRQWREDTVAWTQNVADQLRPGGHLVVVIGDGVTPAGSVDTSAVTEDAAKAAGLDVVARASIERVDHARERMRFEHAFAFAKTRSSEGE
ncbi:MAG: hypothetical protein AAGA48_06890 [Myxococcota bacterium]